MTTLRSLCACALGLLAMTATGTTATAQCSPGATVYNGSGVNPVGFMSVNTPRIGQNWLSAVALGGANVSAVALTLDTLPPGLILSGPVQGEVLCRPPVLAVDYSFIGVHTIAVPNDPALVGRELCAQAVTASPGSIVLQNALTLCIG